ncbi:hypothetical protein RDI58_028191 [Solanum bulbocastanum]|uniref:RNA methyltransferase n=1 Tax=Solanum bulbocastanum TaxID=147425 RepID=A0AAN8SPV5_SOLBU
MAVSPVADLNSKLPLPSGKQQHSKFTGQSVRAIPIRILTVGKNRSQGVQLIVDEYMKKLRNYCSVDDVRIKSNPKNARDIVAQIEHEDIAVMGLIRPDEWVVMLDERGHDVGSEQMASLIGDAGNKVSYASSWQSFVPGIIYHGSAGASSLLFCIGGPYGHGRQLRERANVSVKLSSLVLNHEIALVVLIEQLYRLPDLLIMEKLVKDFYFLELEEGIEMTSKFHSTTIRATKLRFGIPFEDDLGPHYRYSTCLKRRRWLRSEQNLILRS